MKSADSEAADGLSLVIETDDQHGVILYADLVVDLMNNFSSTIKEHGMNAIVLVEDKKIIVKAEVE